MNCFRDTGTKRRHVCVCVQETVFVYSMCVGVCAGGGGGGGGGGNEGAWRLSNVISARLSQI